ncbi:MAG: hypothetical protein ATN34_00490 [Epulopiscium sp. Nele67-Bin002]|nr:MAG: hypothetical protein BEN18_09080 [Epulopiscium sp. Nuni2H_MBin001]OON91953.1 MAG: hypothetical protein ATN34_00490 [Epulopiscium sp. Nele67-Bin002]
MRKLSKSIFIMLMILLIPIYTYANELVMIDGVNIIGQYPELPTGCEATALTMLLQYYGVDITKEEVATDMPKASIPYYSNNVRYGEHPNNAFIGDPFSTQGYGVYSPVIIDMINEYLPNSAINLGGETFELILQSIDSGEPVMIWATINMVAAANGPIWETPNDGTYQWIYHEHALIVVGYDDNYIYVNDPYTGALETYWRQTVINRWESLGKQAVGIKLNDNIVGGIVGDGAIYIEK